VGGLTYYRHNGSSFKSTKLLLHSVAFWSMQGMREQAARKAASHLSRLNFLLGCPI